MSPSPEINDSDLEKVTDSLGNSEGYFPVKSDSPTDELSDLNRRTPVAPVMPGQPNLNPIAQRATGNQSGNNQAPAHTNNSSSAQGNNNINGNTSPATTNNPANQIANSAIDAAEKKGTDFLKKQIAQKAAVFLAANAPVIIGGLLIIIAIILICFGIYAVIMSITGDKGTGIGVDGNTTLLTTVHCEEMSDTLVIPIGGGKSSVTLTLNQTSGGFSPEGGATIGTDNLPVMGDPSNKDAMKGADTDLGDAFAMSSEVAGKFSAEELAFYVTARWMYVENKALESMKISPRGLPPKKYYAGKKVLIYNPKNKKAAVGIIVDEGPNTDLKDRFAGGPTKGAYDLYNKNHGTSYKSLGDILGVESSSDKIVMGFLRSDLQATKAGDFTGRCTEKAADVATSKGISDDRAVGNAGTPKFVANIPGIRQKTPTECNVASAVMVTLHFKPDATGITDVNSDGQTVNKSGLSGGTVGIINKYLEGVKDSQGDIVYSQRKSRPTAVSIKQSIDKGNPVIIVSKNIVSEGQHFVVVVGYDDKYFYVNDPYPWGDGNIHIYANKGHIEKLLTFADLIGNLVPEKDHGYYAIMRN